jgi:hypothetical protein
MKRSEGTVIAVRDPSLLQLVFAEQERRGDSTGAKTLADLARERLMDLEIQRRSTPAASNHEVVVRQERNAPARSSAVA